MQSKGQHTVSCFAFHPIPKWPCRDSFNAPMVAKAQAQPAVDSEAQRCGGMRKHLGGQRFHDIGDNFAHCLCQQLQYSQRFRCGLVRANAWPHLTMVLARKAKAGLYLAKAKDM
jgi:hypothetical protein